ncbi:RNA polymerase sigma factor (sigma-70 family) [Bacillus thermophilus]|uniref:RNA polymerase sigma factor (Sigma-70 family) n=1 Tax=Siminovitchia thermophila TaxID=1245522 RepID=A0ABS2R853_9BACI|nr:sigma-70 family RNA polymerase sigma factor [Siminovitchia thermophila]MBM7715314.1 RNA polymerase sigma factor (sigma-70 family) [Siminovitchia thermophila]
MRENNRVERFYEEHEKTLNNSLVKSFLQIKENQQLLEKAILEPTEENTKTLDNKFREFYLKVRLIKYVSNLIYFYTIDFDKRINKRNQRFNLILDGKANDSHENSTILINNCASSNSTEQDYFNDDTQSFNELIENEKLYEIYNQLTDKQKQILEMIYVRGFTNKEVADYFGETPQNISNLHKRALQRIKEYLLEKG